MLLGAAGAEAVCIAAAAARIGDVLLRLAPEKCVGSKSCSKLQCVTLSLLRQVSGAEIRVQQHLEGSIWYSSRRGGCSCNLRLSVNKRVPSSDCRQSAHDRRCRAGRLLNCLS